MYEVSYYLSRNEIGELWKTAVDELLTKIEDSQSEINVMTGHVTYYGARRKEFYSVINSRQMQSSNLKIDSVALLTDDVYDMYHRLTRKGELFDELTRIPDYLDEVSDERKIDVRLLSPAAQSLWVMKWQKSTLLTLLTWRALETVLAENLAIQFNSRFMLWGVKQRIDAFLKWIHSTQSIYLSHPISEARRKIKVGRKWKQFSFEVNRIQELALKSDLVCMMPTAIDELRFERKYARNKFSWSGLLEPRWPLLSAFANLMYALPAEDDPPNYGQLLLPKFWDFPKDKLRKLPLASIKSVQKEIAEEVDDLSEQIRFQIAIRDHLLVSHAEGLLVYRPYWGGRSRFSRGVKAEVDHWALIASEHNRAAFVHCKDDIEGMISSLRNETSEGQLVADLSNEIENQICQRFGTDRATAKQLLRNVLGSNTSRGILSGGAFPDLLTRLRGDWDQIVNESRHVVLRGHLTGSFGAILAHAGIFVFKNEHDLDSSMPMIKEFFKNGKPDTNGWETFSKDLYPFNPE